MEEKTIPHNKEAEQSVIGSMFLTKYALERAIESLTSDQFYEPAHGKIFNSIKSLSANGTPIDITTVSNDLDSKKELKQIGGLEYLLEITDFKKKDLTLIDEKYQPYFLKLFNSCLFNNLDNTNIYKEYEFIYEENNEEKHGIIDLILEYESGYAIVDYKTKNIEDIEYEKQLKGYQKYLESITSSSVDVYIYSILDETLKML